jgi:hypothetical protein
VAGVGRASAVALPDEMDLATEEHSMLNRMWGSEKQSKYNVYLNNKKYKLFFIILFHVIY